MPAPPDLATRLEVCERLDARGWLARIRSGAASSAGGRSARRVGVLRDRRRVVPVNEAGGGRGREVEGVVVERRAGPLVSTRSGRCGGGSDGRASRCRCERGGKRGIEVGVRIWLSGWSSGGAGSSTSSRGRRQGSGSGDDGSRRRHVGERKRVGAVVGRGERAATLDDRDLFCRCRRRLNRSRRDRGRDATHQHPRDGIRFVIRRVVLVCTGNRARRCGKPESRRLPPTRARGGRRSRPQPDFDIRILPPTLLLLGLLLLDAARDGNGDVAVDWSAAPVAGVSTPLPLAPGALARVLADWTVEEDAGFESGVGRAGEVAAKSSAGSASSTSRCDPEVRTTSRHRSCTRRSCTRVR